MLGPSGALIRLHSAISALTKPRSSRASGRSSRAIRRTSSRLSRTASATPRKASDASAGFPSAARSAWMVTAVSVCPISSWSSRATRRRSASCAASAVRAASCRALSSLSSIELKESASAWPSALRRSTLESRRPGRSGSTELITSVRLISGKRTLPQQDEVQGHEQYKARQEQRELLCLDRSVDRNRAEREQQHGNAKHCRVREEDPPQQRHRLARASPWGDP